MRKHGTAMLLTTLVILSACGGGNDKSASTTTTSAKSATTSARETTTAPKSSTTAGGATTTSGTVGTLPVDLATRCQHYVAFAATIGLAMAAATDPSAASQLEELKKQLGSDEIPAALRDDFNVLTEFSTGLGQVMAKHHSTGTNFDPTSLADIAAYMKGVDQNRLTQASDHIDSWVKENCPS